VLVDGYMWPVPRAARVLERAPEWIVLTSGLEDSLSPRYEVERAIARSPAFKDNYALAENVDGRSCRYWLRIYRRAEAPS